jgi:D-3-phosphoglycerate dehydrogenase
MAVRFRVAVTRDFLKPDGSLCFPDIGLSLLDAAGITWEFLAEQCSELQPNHVRGYDAVLLLGPRVTAASFEGNDRLLLVARFGVGYDNVDVAACTRHGVLLTITPDGVRRPVAAAAITLLLALSHKLLLKDQLTRQGRWSEKLDHMGMGVTGRTLGVIGLGNIGRDIFTLARPFQMRHCAFDPFVTPADAAAIGVDLMPLDELLRSADYVCISCALTPQTRHLVNADRLAIMKPTAYLINVARGPIVDQRALTEALLAGRIAGAGLDVFENEPIDPEDPILKLDNVIVSPHALCWTDECFRGNGHSACQSIVDVSAGRAPRHIVDRSALDHPRVRALGLTPN